VHYDQTKDSYIVPIIELLASSQGSRSSAPNIALAEEIAISGNRDAVSELVDLLKHKDKNIQGDSVKTLYETGYQKPELIAPYYADFLDLLTNRNNRLVWGGMVALTTIAQIRHKELFESLELIMDTVNKGSVITIDCGVEILAKLNFYNTYHNTTDPLLMEQLTRCPIKQLPTYASKSLTHLGDHSREGYKNIITNRINECEKESQRKRLEKILKSIQ
jgi:hypothetical protein